MFRQFYVIFLATDKLCKFVQKRENTREHYVMPGKVSSGELAAMLNVLP